MTANIPTILALDFDGVICDGLIEYFQTAWRTYCEIWSPPSYTPRTDLASSFYRLRPVIETGWEMPVLVEALLQGIPEEKILQNWSLLAQQVLTEAGLVAADISTKLDQVRDEWIATNLADWLEQHRFYPGVVERLQALVSSPIHFIIITTKEGRFVQQLLQQRGVHLPQECIIGKESKRPKYKILQELLGVPSTSWPVRHPSAKADNKSDENLSSTPDSGLPTPDYPQVSLWFVEDRLKTLQLVQQQKDLDGVKLYLADWGYNTPQERETADRDPRIQLLSLSQFARDFSTWP